MVIFWSSERGKKSRSLWGPFSFKFVVILEDNLWAKGLWNLCIGLCWISNPKKNMPWSQPHNHNLCLETFTEWMSVSERAKDMRRPIAESGYSGVCRTFRGRNWHPPKTQRELTTQFHKIENNRLDILIEDKADQNGLYERKPRVV